MTAKLSCNKVYYYYYLSALRGDEVFKYPSVVVRGLIFGSASYDLVFLVF